MDKWKCDLQINMSVWWSVGRSVWHRSHLLRNFLQTSCKENRKLQFFSEHHEANFEALN